MPSRRDLLAGSVAAAAALAGCLDDVPGTKTGDGDRPVATSRDPDPLDVSGAWPQHGGGPGHAGLTAATGAPDGGTVHWHLRRIRSGPPAFAGGRLYHYAELGEDTSGTPTLTRTRPPDAGTAHPVSGAPSLVARRASDGRIEWVTELPEGGVGVPAVADGAVVATARGRITARDAADGAARWSHDPAAQPTGNPTVADGVAIVPLDGVSDGGGGDPVHEPSVRAYDLAGGTERWSVGAPYRETSVAVAGDDVLVLSHDFDGSAVLQARSLASGVEHWRTALSGEFRFEGPVVAGGRVHVGGSDGRLRVRSLADGSALWSASGGGEWVAAGEDLVVGASDDRLVAREAADGAHRWTVTSDEGTFRAPAVGGDAVYAGGIWAGLRALDPADGGERWAHTFPTKTVEGDMVMRGLETQPTVADGAVYAMAVDGLYAFGPA